ncbi:M50 family metallopeptidase [Myxococcota bacterium]|nr:M50 family metallopeptidase [Myxococcota bacterium]MBU1430050.1 M50 family metallopeptidase [Myxococcota bacterium]MBU1896418.1 M50 family metallopeptidase [Myxococcota bacterium]
MNRLSMYTARLFLLASVVLTILLYVMPHGAYIAYPLTLLSTMVHEMGHGFSAMLIGGDFNHFKMWADGSGVAEWSGDVGRLGKAFVSAGGLVGPSVVAALGFYLGRSAKLSQLALKLGGVALFIIIGLVVRNLFGFFFVAVVGLSFLFVAYKTQAWFAQITVVFLSSQLALSVFSRGDYLFTAYAQTAQGKMASDTQHMADALWLPYWFWGALCGLFSVLVLIFGLWLFFKSPEGKRFKDKPADVAPPDDPAPLKDAPAA